MKSYPYVAGGTAQVRIPVIMRSSTDGSLKASLAHGDMTVVWQRNGTTTNVSMASGTAGSYTSGGWVAAARSEGGASIAGHYEFGVPGACFQTDDVVITISFSATGALPTVIKFQVGNVPVNVVEVSGDASAADNLKAGYDGTGYAGGSTKQVVEVGAYTSGYGPGEQVLTNTDNRIAADGSGRVTAVEVVNNVNATVTSIGNNVITAAAIASNAITDTKINTGAITAAKIASDALTAAKFHSDVTTELQAGLMTAADANVAAIKAKTDNLPASPAAAGEYTAAIADIPTVAEFNARSLPAADYTVVSDLITAASIADAVWDEVQSGHVSAGTFGLYLDAKVSEAGGGGLTAESVADAVWDEVLSGHSTAGTAGAGLAAAQSAGDPWATNLPGAYAAGSAGEIVSQLPSIKRIVQSREA